MPTPDAVDPELASDLVTYAARLVRAMRHTNELPAGTRVLSLLDQLGPSGVTALAQADRCSQPTMSTAVKELDRLGWVSKQPNPVDSRGQVVTLTAAGRAELGRVRRRNGDVVVHRLEHHPTHTAEDLATAVAVLRDLLDTDHAGIDPEKGLL